MTIRIRSSAATTGGVLLSRNEERVMRLAPLVHLELEPRMTHLQLVDELGDVRPVRAFEHRDEAARLREQRREHAARHVVEALTLRDGLAACKAQVVALVDRQPVELRIL